MNTIKRSLGYVWMMLGPLAMIFMLWQATEKIGEANKLAKSLANDAAQSVAVNTILQWSIIILVFLPIAFGMVIFGKYAVKGEYDQLSQNSAGLEAETN